MTEICENEAEYENKSGPCMGTFKCSSITMKYGRI